MFGNLLVLIVFLKRSFLSLSLSPTFCSPYPRSHDNQNKSRNEILNPVQRIYKAREIVRFTILLILFAVIINSVRAKVSVWSFVERSFRWAYICPELCCYLLYYRNIAYKTPPRYVWNSCLVKLVRCKINMFAFHLK